MSSTMLCCAIASPKTQELSVTFLYKANASPLLMVVVAVTMVTALLLWILLRYRGYHSVTMDTAPVQDFQAATPSGQHRICVVFCFGGETVA